MTFRRKLSSTWLISVCLSLATASPLTPRSTSNAATVGLHWAPNNTCDATATSQVLTAISDALALSNSAIAALSKPDSNPAAYFFRSDDASSATNVFKTVNIALAPDASQTYTNLNPIQLFCQDLDSKCSPNIWGYIPDGYNPAPGFGTTSQPALFVVCPSMLALPRNPQSCTGTPGLASVGWAFLRTFVQLRSVQPGYAKLAARGIADSAPGVAASHQLAQLKAGGAVQNADNFAQLATWSHDLGVTGDGVQCPDECGLMGPDAGC